MKVGDLVRIRGIEAYLGLFVVRKDYNDGLWISAYSFDQKRNHDLRIGTLEVICEGR